MSGKTCLRRLALLLVLSLTFVAAACDKARHDSNVLANRGVEAYNRGQSEVAFDFFVRALHADPNNDLAHYHLGLVERYDRGETAASKRRFQEALRINPENSDAAFQLASIFLDEEQIDTAHVHANRAVETDPQSHQAQYLLGRILELQGSFPEADRQYRRSLALYPLYPPAFVALGALYLRFDELELAIEVLREGVRLNPDNAELQTYLGLALMEVRDYDNALRPFERAVSINPQNPLHYFNLGSVFERLGNTQRTIDILQHFIEISLPEHATEVSLAKAMIDRVLLDAHTRAQGRSEGGAE